MPDCRFRITCTQFACAIRFRRYHLSHEQAYKILGTAGIGKVFMKLRPRDMMLQHRWWGGRRLPCRMSRHAFRHSILGLLCT